MIRVKPVGTGSVLHKGRGGHWTRKPIKVYPEPEFDLNRWRAEHGYMSIIECAERLGIRPADVKSLENGSKKPTVGWDYVIKILSRS